MTLEPPQGEHRGGIARVKAACQKRRRRRPWARRVNLGETRRSRGTRQRRRDAPFLRELMRSNDLVRLSWLTSLLADAGIKCHLLDAHMSALEGSIGAIPRRLMVGDEDFERAHRLLAAAGESAS